MILVIDNYDSFTYNLVQLLAALGADVHVERNDALTADEALALAPAGIVISPGPGTPDDAGISRDVVRLAAGAGAPVLG
ncbi:MAG: glutamine amidotransferase-related protein, partial [Coriobacteriia bacterium]